jgi:hypothetical protein
VAAAVALAGVVGAAPAAAQAPAPVTFSSTGAQQTYVVPAGIGKPPPGVARITDQVAASGVAPTVRITPIVGSLPREVVVTRTGAGSGTVTSTPAGIDRGADCSGTFPEGTTVTLVATPASGSVFAGWSGACTNAGNVCTVTVAQANAVTASFAPEARLSVLRAGDGEGGVSSSPFGIVCPQRTCATSRPAGDVVTLTATPEDGSVFAGWSGGGCTGTDPCVVTLPAGATEVTATFLPATTLTVVRAGPGGGRVVSAPAGIDCGDTCSQPFGVGSRVTLTAVPDLGSTVAGFSGATCEAPVSACTLTLHADRAVAVSFGTAPPGDPGPDGGPGPGNEPIPGGSDVPPGGAPGPGDGTPGASPGPATGAAAGGPRLTLGRARAARATSRGRVTTAVRLACAGPTARCSASARATIRVRSSRGRLRTVVAGRATVTALRGRSATARITLNRSARRRLADARRLRLTVTVQQRTAAPGTPRTVRHVMTVRR